MTTTAARTGSTTHDQPVASDGGVATEGVPEGFLLACPACRLTGGPFASRTETDLHRVTHDQVHHGSRPTAAVAGLQVCEGCRARPATIVWPYPPAGDPFRLCAACCPGPQPTPHPGAALDRPIVLLPGEACLLPDLGEAWPAARTGRRRDRRPAGLGEAIGALLAGWGR